MDTVTQVQNAMDILTSQIVDCLGQYPKKIQELYSPDKSEEALVKCSTETVQTFLKYVENFKTVAGSLSSLADKEGQLNRIKELETEIQSVDKQIKESFDESRELKNKVEKDYDILTQSYLSSVNNENSNADFPG